MIDKNIVYVLQGVLVLFCLTMGISDKVFCSIFSEYMIATDGIVVGRTLCILLGIFLLEKLLSAWKNGEK